MTPHLSTRAVTYASLLSLLLLVGTKLSYAPIHDNWQIGDKWQIGPLWEYSEPSPAPDELTFPFVDDTITVTVPIVNKEIVIPTWGFLVFLVCLGLVGVGALMKPRAKGGKAKGTTGPRSRGPSGVKHPSHSRHPKKLKREKKTGRFR